MNRKGEIGIGIIMVTFITVIVGVILLQAIAQQVGSSTSTVAVVNETFETPANGTAGVLTNYRAISDLTVVNASNNAAVGSGNYTVANNVITNGALTVTITPDASAGYADYDWNLSYTGQPTTYIADSGSRSVAALIVLMVALAVAVVAMYPVFANKLGGLLNK